MLNALVWSAGVEVPAGGVEAKFYTHDEIAQGGDRAAFACCCSPATRRTSGTTGRRPIRRIREALERDPRISVDVSLDIEDWRSRI